MSSLSNVIGQSEGNEADQNDEVLGSVADYFNQLANYVTKPNAIITNEVYARSYNNHSYSLISCTLYHHTTGC